jgi:hypothetical protein
MISPFNLDLLEPDSLLSLRLARSLAADDPNLNVRRLVANQECHYSVVEAPQRGHRWCEKPVDVPFLSQFILLDF